MPAKDRYHDTVKRALIKEGWLITDEQVTLIVDKRYLWVDLTVSKVSTGFVIL
ncbi:MAG: xisH family protein [Burkholderiales bacterium]|nr:xisH family protein [Anaerolineae bacterium]